jgi:hypothetical protein
MRPFCLLGRIDSASGRYAAMRLVGIAKGEGEGPGGSQNVTSKATETPRQALRAFRWCLAFAYARSRKKGVRPRWSSRGAGPEAARAVKVSNALETSGSSLLSSQ